MVLNKTNGTELEEQNGMTWDEDPTFHLILVVLACIIVLVNAPIIVFFFKMPSLRHSTANTFLVGLALADMLCGLIMIPAALLCELNTLPPSYRHGVCRFYYVSNYTISISSVYHILAASFAKYFAIVYPVRNITLFTASRVKYVSAIIWLTGFLASHLPIYWPYLSYEDFLKIVKIHGIFLFVFVLVIPTAILFFIHLHIYGNLFWKRRPTTQARQNSGRDTHRENSRVVILFLVLFLVFLISWLPWYLIGAGWIDEDDSVLLTLRFLAPILNPLVFTLVKRDFRKAMTSVIEKSRRRRRNTWSVRSTNATRTESSCDGVRRTTIDQTKQKPCRLMTPYSD